MGNWYSYKVTFQLYAFNQVIKGLEIQLCWKKYWLYLHKPPSSALLALLLSLLSALITECTGRNPPVAQGMEWYVPVRGFEGCPWHTGLPKSKVEEPWKPAQFPSKGLWAAFPSGLLPDTSAAAAAVTLGGAWLGQQQASSELYCGFVCSLLQPGSELDNLEEILDDLQNSQLPQLFPDSRPGVPAGSVDKQAIINDLMQLTSDSSPGAAVATQKPAMRISQSSECTPPSTPSSGTPQCRVLVPPGQPGRSWAAPSSGLVLCGGRAPSAVIPAPSTPELCLLTHPATLCPRRRCQGYLQIKHPLLRWQVTLWLWGFWHGEHVHSLVMQVILFWQLSQQSFSKHEGESSGKTTRLIEGQKIKNAQL